jgi:hypothetical protein
MKHLAPALRLAAVTWLTGAAPGLAAVNPVVPPDVFYIAGSTRKISQLIGDTDFQWLTPTTTRTETRVGISGSDLGVPFTHKGRTYVVFGDSGGGGVFGDRDPLAFTTDTDLEDGLDLTFLANGSVWRPVTIPGISQGAYEVPLDGVSLGNRMYLYHSTDHSESATMGRSVLAVSDNDGQDFTLLYTVSTSHFINISVSRVNLADWPGFPEEAGEGLVLFGSGSYRASNVRLAFQPATGIGSVNTLRYFTGLDGSGHPVWSENEEEAMALFEQPCVGELSVGWNKFIRRWLMLYNCDPPRGINFRTARQPWGPWSTPQVLFEPWDDLGYAHFMHASWTFRIFDNVHNPGRQNEWGGEYGPYLFRELPTGTDNRATVYFTLSSWNPYVSVLMKSELAVNNSPVITLPPADQQVMAGEPAVFQISASAVGTLAYAWRRNDANVPGATSNVLILPAVAAADQGALFRCVVTGSSGSVTSAPARLAVTPANQAPTPEILSPSAEHLYHGGEIVTFHGTATDPEDGILPASAFRWRVQFHHGNHVVPFLASLSGVTNGSFAVPMRGEQATNVYFRLLLTVTDSAGRQATVSRNIFPQTALLTLRTEPAGLPLALDGQSRSTPAMVQSVVGMKRVLRAVNPSSLAGRTYDWRDWSDGGAVSHTVTIQPTNTIHVASFRTPTVLIATNAIWKYFVTPSAPSTAWKGLGFDDTSWPTGRAQLGYGDNDEATPIGWGPDSNNRYITTYFRSAFTVAEPGVFGSLLVRLLRDDGGVVYLNGVEVFRSNMGGGAPAWRTEAPAAALPADEISAYYTTNVSPALLRRGTNVIAVEIHQNGTNSSDLSFALELRASEYDPRLTIARVGPDWTVRWPYPSAGFILQQATQLGSNAIWTIVNAPVQITNGENYVTFPSSPEPAFLRLRSP